MPESQFCLDARPGTLVGPIDLTRITPENLPTILQRICDEIQALKTDFAEVKADFAKSEKKREEDYAKILQAIETNKACNDQAITEYSTDAENLKTFMKICKFAIAHPWMAAGAIIGTFAIIDYAMRFSYWGIWPK